MDSLCKHFDRTRDYDHSLCTGRSTLDLLRKWKNKLLAVSRSCPRKPKVYHKMP